jgi:hypothetical protein
MRSTPRVTSLTTLLLIGCAAFLGLSFQALQHGKSPGRSPRVGPAGPDEHRLDPRAAFAHRGATPRASSTAGITTQDLNSGLTPLDLAQALVGPGIVVSNVTGTLDPSAAGLFGSGLAPIGISNGILLSSGNIASVVGPNVAMTRRRRSPRRETAISTRSYRGIRRMTPA